MPSSFQSKSPRAVALGLLLAATTVAAIASAKLAKSGPGTAGFKASGPAGMTIDGTTSDVNVGEDASGVVVVTVSLANISTGMSLRDKHTKEYLEVDKYPTAELRIARAALKVPPPGGDSSGDARGSLKIHGQSKDVTVRYTAKRDGDAIDVRGSTRVNMNDFGIKTPSYLGVAVKPDVDISTHFAAKD